MLRSLLGGGNRFGCRSPPLRSFSHQSINNLTIRGGYHRLGLARTRTRDYWCNGFAPWRQQCVNARISDSGAHASSALLKRERIDSLIGLAELVLRLALCTVLMHSRRPDTRRQTRSWQAGCCAVGQVGSGRAVKAATSLKSSALSWRLG